MTTNDDDEKAVEEYIRDIIGTRSFKAAPDEALLGFNAGINHERKRMQDNIKDPKRFPDWDRNSFISYIEQLEKKYDVQEGEPDGWVHVLSDGSYGCMFYASQEEAQDWRIVPVKLVKLEIKEK